MTSHVNKCHLLLPNNKIPKTGRILFDQYKCTQSQTPPSRSFIHLTFPEDTPLDTYLSTSIHDTPYLVAGGGCENLGSAVVVGAGIVCCDARKLSSTSTSPYTLFIISCRVEVELDELSSPPLAAAARWWLVSNFQVLRWSSKTRYMLHFYPRYEFLRGGT